MTMKCRGCKSVSSIEVRTQYQNGKVYEYCDRCGSFSLTGIPDVYFRGPEFCKELGDPKDPKKWMGQHIGSKREKARILKELGLQEAGDYRHGARAEVYKQKLYSIGG
jgi:RNA polymerase subunit RPABC4/transcription elongation factor Spt4